MDQDQEFFEDKVLERELRQAMRSEETISLFKVVRDNLQIKHELANSKAVQTVVALFWGNVADFFDSIASVESIAELPANDPLVVAHARMRANFDAVAAINDTFKDARIAEEQLLSEDLDQEGEEL